MEASERLPLPVELHSTTRTEHATLNRTIFARLPLCLPQSTSSPALYAQGMTVIAQIYYGIEEAWDILLSRKSLSEIQRQIVEGLNISQLRRVHQLEANRRRLRAACGHVFDTKLSALQDATSHFREEIKQSILAKPHLLMAYTWTMYLALFNGGRWIAKQLLSAGTLFWRDHDQAAIVRGSLSFWFFGDSEDYDGEDIKIAFKDRFNALSQGLTDQERDEILAESKRIFGICAEMVEFLDQHVQGEEAGLHTQTAAVTGDLSHKAAKGTDSTSYFTSLAPSSVASMWRFIMDKIPSAQALLPATLRQEMDQRHA